MFVSNEENIHNDHWMWYIYSISLTNFTASIVPIIFFTTIRFQGHVKVIAMVLTDPVSAVNLYTDVERNHKEIHIIVFAHVE